MSPRFRSNFVHSERVRRWQQPSTAGSQSAAHSYHFTTQAGERDARRNSQKIARGHPARNTTCVRTVRWALFPRNTLLFSCRKKVAPLEAVLLRTRGQSLTAPLARKTQCHKKLPRVAHKTPTPFLGVFDTFRRFARLQQDGACSSLSELLRGLC